MMTYLMNFILKLCVKGHWQFLGHPDPDSKQTDEDSDERVPVELGIQRPFAWSGVHAVHARRDTFTRLRVRRGHVQADTLLPRLVQSSSCLFVQYSLGFSDLKLNCIYISQTMFCNRCPSNIQNNM